MTIVFWIAALAVGLGTTLAMPSVADQVPDVPAAIKLDLRWSVKIPMRDGVILNANLYQPRHMNSTGCIFNLSPYSIQAMHERGVYFAEHGFAFLIVDSRGRGDSQGQFKPFLQEAHDGYDIVEWLAKQSYCNGKVAMWGGSYMGYDEWATIKERPPHLVTIVPTASVYPGLDFPMRANIAYPYVAQWLSYVSGHELQQKIFTDAKFWTDIDREWFESGAPFKALTAQAGTNEGIFLEWIAHPQLDAYWDEYVPTPQQYASLDLPILTITGSNDDDQPGALAYYRNHMRYGSDRAKASHYLVIGPWDHPGTRTPKPEVDGLKFGPESLVDMNRLHLEWYNWTLAGQSRPAFLQQRVAYYVMGAEKWRYADTLEAVTNQNVPFFLDSRSNANDVIASGFLDTRSPGKGKPDLYIYDPRDINNADLESAPDVQGLTDQRLTYANRGKQLVYHSALLDADTEVSGFFKLTAWIGIDQPDTDFSVSIYEIAVDGSSKFLTSDLMRARYREGLRESKLVRTKDPLRYDFDHFTFVSRQLKKGSRIRLVIGPINSISSQKNYNSGGVVSEEAMRDARRVTVRLLHSSRYPSALYVPIGQP